MRRYLFIILLFLFFSNSPLVFAESFYVLPYPSTMPGSIFYKLEFVKEFASKFWYFGDFGQFKYNLEQSDKYLVEGKTLFEYKQYLLAYRALLKSNEYFKNVQPSLARAELHRKDISEKRRVFEGAKEKHIEVLSKLKSEVPEFVEWRPEKERSSNLDLWNLISYSIKIRQKAL